jgi:hypothetical protein
MKTCKICREAKTHTDFPKSSARKDGLLKICRQCLAVMKAQDYKDKWFSYQVRLKRAFSKQKGLPFNLTEDYLKSIWTDNCPVFDKPFVKFDKSNDLSPALDRIIPELGYVKGNVCYISARANRIKYDATVEEIKQVLKFMEGATTISKESTPERVEAPDTEHQ